MEVAITKMSQNGQVVIPVEIRKDAHIKPLSKFLVFNRNGEITLKPLKKEELGEDPELIEMVEESEKQIERREVVKANSKMSVKEIDDLLMS